MARQHEGWTEPLLTQDLRVLGEDPSQTTPNQLGNGDPASMREHRGAVVVVRRNRPMHSRRHVAGSAAGGRAGGASPHALGSSL